MKIVAIALCAMLMSGCATMARHPRLTAIAAAVIIGSAVASIDPPKPHPTCEHPGCFHDTEVR